MEVFFEKSANVNVSRVSKKGWWLGNTTEHVVKGTALGADFTQNIYTPSKAGMIARYDLKTGVWLDEIEDMTFKKYFDVNGQDFIIGEPDGEYPEWAIREIPPEYDKKTHTALYIPEHGWTVFDIKIGTPFYDEWGVEFIVSDYNFKLPDSCTWEAPPKPDEHHAVRLVNKQWQQFIDNRGKFAYAKNRDDQEINDYLVEALGPLPLTHVLCEPGMYDSWVSDDIGWQYDIERHKQLKGMEEKQWRNEAMTRVINRIDQYEKDQNYPIELRTSPIKNETDFHKLLADRKALSDYPTSANFPFSERPKLSTD